MPKQPSLRIQEEIIEEFGVSRKYTILLAVFGLILIILAFVFSAADDPLISAVAAGAGPLAPLVFMVVEVAIGAVGIFLTLRAIYLVLAYHYFLTSQRVMESVGFLAERSVSADYGAITDIVVRQDPINRLLLNAGTLSANTPGGIGEELILTNIDNPEARREQLRRLAQAAESGQAINPAYLASLKVQTGMAKDLDGALASLGKETPAPGEVASPAPLPEPEPEQPVNDLPSAEPTPQMSDNGLDDLHGDGIDESDRLRAAQRKLQEPNG